MITETEIDFIINNSIDYSARFTKANRPIIDLLMSGRRFSYQEITRLIAPTRLKELEDKRILLRGEVPALTGRYSRQIGFLSLLSDDFRALQHRLRSAHVLVLGAGAIGSHVVWNLAAMGIGKLTLVDFDHVEETNLNRQLMYTPADVGQLKVEVLARRISEFNPTVKIASVVGKIEGPADIKALLEGVDLVVKAIDTPEQASSWLNGVCVEARIPWVQGGFIDRTAVVGPNYFPGGTGCFACISPETTVRRLFGTGPTFAPLATLVSALLAMLIFKALTGKAEALGSKIHTFDLEDYKWRSVDLHPVRDCDVCGARKAEPTTREVSGRSARWVQRGSYLLLLSLIVLIRSVLDQPVISLIGLVMTFAAIPVVRRLEQGDVRRTRQELFLIAVAYVALSVAGALIASGIRGGIVWPATVDGWATMLRTGFAVLLQVVIGITVIFFLMIGAEKLAAKLDSEHHERGV